MASELPVQGAGRSARPSNRLTEPARSPGGSPAGTAPPNRYGTDAGSSVRPKASQKPPSAVLPLQGFRYCTRRAPTDQTAAHPLPKTSVCPQQRRRYLPQYPDSSGGTFPRNRWVSLVRIEEVGRVIFRAGTGSVSLIKAGFCGEKCFPIFGMAVLYPPG